jgi:peptidoglycan hydrolase-like protein with peptidoglycan-binding domain
MLAVGLTVIATAATLTGGVLISRQDAQQSIASADGTTTSIAPTGTTLATSLSTSTTTPSTPNAPTTSGAPTVQPVWAPVAWNGNAISRGTKSDAVLSIKQRMDQLKFDVGTVNNAYDTNLYHAVMAFQKVHGLTRNGQLTAETITALQSAQNPEPLVPEVGATRVEVFIPSQTLRYWVDGQLVRILSVSTGNNARYCENGACGVAKTPRGIHQTYRRIKGVRVAQLGTLYDPVYFKGGFAIHGSPSVPAGPASHGCVRVPMVSSRWVYDNVPDGVPVVVTDEPTLNPEWIVAPAPPVVPTFA